jgi:hypothetical protein
MAPVAGGQFRQGCPLMLANITVAFPETLAGCVLPRKGELRSQYL